MNQIETMRQTLYKVLEQGDTDSILKISQELDKLIYRYMKKQLKLKDAF